MESAAQCSFLIGVLDQDAIWVCTMHSSKAIIRIIYANLHIMCKVSFVIPVGDQKDIILARTEDCYSKRVHPNCLCLPMQALRPCGPPNSPRDFCPPTFETQNLKEVWEPSYTKSTIPD